MTKKERKNYIKLTVILLITIILAIASSNIYRNYENNKSKKSYITKYVSTIQFKDLSNSMLEFTGKNYIYLSYTSKNIYEFEKKLRKQLVKYGLEDNFIFVDCSNDVDSEGRVKDLKKILSAGNKDLVLPAIVYFNDSNPVDYIDSSSGLINTGDFAQLLDQYEIEANK